jgi:hypothetical protein
MEYHSGINNTVWIKKSNLWNHPTKLDFFIIFLLKQVVLRFAILQTTNVCPDFDHHVA